MAMEAIVDSMESQYLNVIILLLYMIFNWVLIIYFDIPLYKDQMFQYVLNLI